MHTQSAFSLYFRCFVLYLFFSSILSIVFFRLLGGGPRRVGPTSGRDLLPLFRLGDDHHRVSRLSLPVSLPANSASRSVDASRCSAIGHCGCFCGVGNCVCSHYTLSIGVVMAPLSSRVLRLRLPLFVPSPLPSYFAPCYIPCLICPWFVLGPGVRCVIQRCSRCCPQEARGPGHPLLRGTAV